MPAKRVGAGGINKIRQHDDRIEEVEKQVKEIKEHIIHKDGTYSNGSAHTVLDKVRSGEIKKLAIGTATHKQLVRVVQMDRFGIFTEPLNGPHRDRSECSFWKWGELEEEVLKPV